MTRLRRDEEVSLAVLGRICGTLGVDIGEIMEFITEEETDNGREKYSQHWL